MSLRSLASLSFAILFLGLAVTASAQEHRYGAIREASLPEWIKPAPPVAPQDGWDDYVDLSPNFPPIGNQGGQGSCTAWAVAYYYKSYQEWQEHGWAYTDETRFSPAFVYNQINGGVDWGSSPTDAFKMLCENGAPPYSLMPYTDQNCTAFPSEEAFYAAIPYRSQETFYFPIHQDLEGLKAHLLNGNAATFAFTVYSNFDNISNYNYIYCLSDISGDPRGGHAVCLCGFDDNLVTSDGVGAFKVANSWGGSWGQAGYWWISYECFQSYVTWDYAYYCTDRIDYVPTTLAVFKVEHSDRYSMSYTFGVGETQSPDWSQSFLNYGGSHAAIPYPNSNIIVDLTDAVPYLDEGGINDIYMRARDLKDWNGYSGQILDFEVVQLDWPAFDEAEDLPVAIPDNGAFVYSQLDLAVGASTPISGTLSGTLENTGDPYYVMGDLQVADGSSLTIEPGAELVFFDHYKIDVGADAEFHADDVYFRPLLSAVGWAGFRMDGASDASSIENCTIEYAKATGEESEANGGAIYIKDCSPTISTTSFESCKAELGGVAYLENSEATLYDNTFTANYASGDGGVIYCLNSSSAQIEENNFDSNEALNGAAIYLENSSPWIETNYFLFNEANQEGGVICVNGDTPQIAGNSFANNHANHGGAIAILNGTPGLNDNEFYDNTAQQGGAVYIMGAGLSLTDCILEGNTASTGGAIYGFEATLNMTGNDVSESEANNGGAVNVWFSEFNCEQNSFRDNAATGFGGAVYLLASTAEINNSLFGDNTANNSAALYQVSTDLTMINCTIAYNDGANVSGGLGIAANSSAMLMNNILYFNDPAPLFADASSSCSVYYCDVEGGWEGMGNIDASPMLMSYEDFNLADWSPCIGAGVAELQVSGDSFSAPNYDMNNSDRPQPVGSAPDMGCYENALGTPTAVSQEVSSGLPENYAMHGAYPNPFNPSTTIQFDLPTRSIVKMSVYDISGRLVATLVDGYRDAGYHQVTFDANGMASGMYLLKMQADDFNAVSKLLLIK